jgi:hypothetical protein
LALALCAFSACKGKDDAAVTKTGAPDIERRCLQLAKVCGDKGKHVDKITEECKDAAAKQAVKGCSDEAITTYDCYERELCASGDKVWTIEDLGKLAIRHKKCVVEQDATRACMAK